MSDIISWSEARRRVLSAAIPCLDSQETALADALGRRLAEDAVASEPWPTTARSAMDGFALATGGAGAAAGATYPLVGSALAGHPFEGELAVGEAVRMMTGGVVPAGADTVIRVEDTGGYDADPVEVRTAVAAGANIRPRGSELAAGAVVIAAGAWIRPPEVAALAALGRERVRVVRRPRVAILATGDEVVPICVEPLPHQVRDSNSHALAAQVAAAGGEPLPLGIAADDAAVLEYRIVHALAAADVLLTVGGVSKGTHDLVHGTLERLGVSREFHGVALKPGKPVFFGLSGDDPPRYVFGLPGNPASCMTVFDLLVRPLLAALAGAADETPWHAAVGGAPFRANWRAQAIPARLSAGPDGRLRAELEPVRPSGDPFGLLPGDGFAVVPPDTAAPDVVQVVPYAGGLRGRR